MKAQFYFFYTLTLFIFTSLLSCVVIDATNDIGNVNFSLTKGTKNLALTDALVYDTNVYVLTMENTNFQVDDNYKVSYNPMDALKIVANTSNTVSFQVVNVGSGSLTISATHSNDITLSGSVVFTLAKASYSASQTPIAYSPTNTISTSGTYPVLPIVNKMDAFFPKYPLSVKVSPTLPTSISNDGRVYLTTEASVSTNKVTVTFISSNYVDYSNTFYVQVKDALVPQAVFTSTPSSPLTFGVGNNYTVTANLTNSDGSKVAGITEDFRFTASPLGAIVGISSNSTSYTFAVTNASYGNVRIAAVHKQSNTLSVGQSFTLAKRSYPRGVTPIVYSASNFVVSRPSAPGKISPSSDSRVNYYPQGNLTISKVSGPDTYSFNASSGEITFTGGGSYEFQAKFISSNYTDYTTSSFTVTVEYLTRFGEVVQGGSIPDFASGTDEFTRTVLSPLGVATGGTLAARYTTESGAGLQNGTSWANAWAATDLRNGINDISDASINKAYVVLVASGTYKPVDTTATATTAERGISFTMKNHVAIIGGFTSSGGWERSGTTTFSGDIGTEGTTDNSYQVFSHSSVTLDNGLLYGVTITKANANAAAFPQNIGGGMYNSGSSPRLVNVVVVSNSAGQRGGGMYNEASSSPVLTGVEFAGNSAKVGGGGMYNTKSSPVLTRVEFNGNSSILDGGGIFNSISSPVLTRVKFIGNSADNSGGGMFNEGSSSPVLRGVVFSSNSSTGISDSVTKGGGGMYNGNSSPVLTGVVFDGNSANGEGGGMFNKGSSSPVLTGAVFRGNSARNNGGAMYSFAIKSGYGPVVVNSIFTANSATTGEDIVLDRNGSGNNINIQVAGSVLGIGKANAISGIVVTTTSSSLGSYNITHHSLANGAVNFGADASTSAATGGLTYPTIQSTSSAKDIGLYVRKSGTDYYFSQDGTDWYTEFSATGGFSGNTATLPTSGVEDLTATDIAGNARVNRPDAGVHEYTP